MRISEAIQEFLSEHIARGSRPKTIKNYDSMLNLLLRPYIDRQLSDLTPFLINKCLSTLAERGVKSATLVTADRTLRVFCSWLIGVELISKNPMLNRKKPKTWHEPKPVLTDEEIQSLFDTIKKDKRHVERNRAIIYLLLSTGIRAGELCNLCMSDIDWSNRVLTVRGKTGYGTVPMDSKTVQILRRYITHGRKTVIPQVFVYNNKPLNTQSLSRLIHRIAKRADIKRPLGPHAFRHCFASRFMEQNPDPFALKRILRHSTLDTSMKYVHSSMASIRDKMEQSSVMRSIQT